MSLIWFYRSSTSGQEDAASETIGGGKKESIAGPRRTVLVLSSAPKVFKAERGRFERGPDKIRGNILGVIKSIRTGNPWIVRVYKTVHQVGPKPLGPKVLYTAVGTEYTDRLQL